MIVDEKNDVKVFENLEEVLIVNSIKNIEDRIRTSKLGLEIDEKILEFLKSKQLLGIPNK